MKIWKLVGLGVGCLLLGMGIALWVLSYPSATREKATVASTAESPIEVLHKECDQLEIYRESNQELIRPFLLMDEECESPSLAILKEKIIQKINTYKTEKRITRSSVFFKYLNSLQWLGVDAHELYYPGSLNKVPMMIHIMKQSEENSKTLTEVLPLVKAPAMEQIVPSNAQLDPTKGYYVNDLLRMMIVRSDNDAAATLAQKVNVSAYGLMFNELGLTALTGNSKDWNYQISAKDYSKFLRVLYNSTYLNRKNSIYCLDMLNHTEYKNGFLRFLPESQKCAHKFGERFTKGETTQFHESGIFYLGGKSYVLTVMTEGYSADVLQQLLAEISKICYDYVNADKRSSRMTENPEVIRQG
ncbi:MAG: serine hydrolase [Flavobacteriales bacterium]